MAPIFLSLLDAPQEAVRKASPSVLNSHEAKEKVETEVGDWVMVAVIALFGLLVSLGTIPDLLLNVFHVKIFPDKFLQLVQGFSLYTNSLKLFNTNQSSPDSLPCINGIRFLSMTWVLMGHTYSTVMSGLLNNNMMIPYGDMWLGNKAFAVMANAFPSVDSFFLIGSTLLTYGVLKQLEQRGGGLKFWILYFVHRYIRLTGVYAVIILFHATLLKHFATGPTSYNITWQVQGCRDTWWTNFLYVNNLHWLLPKSTWGCLGQTWYMANDMQFFLLTPPILALLWKRPRLGVVLCSVLTAVATAIPLAIAWAMDYPFGPMTDDPEIGNDYMANFYIVPWCRYQPYIGIKTLTY